MKLNTDCIRAVMLEIEKSLKITVDAAGVIQMDDLSICSLYVALPKYDKADIFYALFNLEQAGYLDLTTIWADGGLALDCTINHMTFEGHEFLDRIRDPKHWSVIKSGLSAVRNYSLDAINAIAGGVTSAAIAAYLEHNPL